MRRNNGTKRLDLTRMTTIERKGEKGTEHGKGWGKIREGHQHRVMMPLKRSQIENDENEWDEVDEEREEGERRIDRSRIAQIACT